MRAGLGKLQQGCLAAPGGELHNPALQEQVSRKPRQNGGSAWRKTTIKKYRRRVYRDRNGDGMVDWEESGESRGTDGFGTYKVDDDYDGYYDRDDAHRPGTDTYTGHSSTCLLLSTYVSGTMITVTTRNSSTFPAAERP